MKILILIGVSFFYVNAYFYNDFPPYLNPYTNYIRRFAKFSDNRIINGENAEEGQFPHQVSIGFFCNDGYYQHNCGGSVVAQRWILTAAHCASKKTARVVVAGVINLKKRKKNNEYFIEESITHPEYIPLTTSDNGYNDIALLKLDRDLEFGRNIQPIDLKEKDVPDSAKLIISGWGRTTCKHTSPCTETQNLANHLQYLTVRYVNNVKCYSIFHNGGKSAMDPTYLCTVPKKDTGAYQGDSGGPLVYKNKLVGVAFAVGPCGKGYPDVFTRVSKFYDWITNNIQDDDDDYDDDYKDDDDDYRKYFLQYNWLG